MLSETVRLAAHLIQQPSITPHDAGCQKIIAHHLEKMGFIVQHIRFGSVDNMWATRQPVGETITTLVFVGHTDVVPEGDTAVWRFDPFEAHIENGILYGRGAVDMKGALAAFIIACKKFIAQNAHTSLRLAILLTSSEEVFSKNGIKRMYQWLEDHQEACPYILIGEPSSTQVVGDTVRKGRRGSLTGTVILQGRQSHVAYTHSSDNLIHQATCALAQLVQADWGSGIDVFPPPTLHIISIESGLSFKETGNVTPPTFTCCLNIRFPPNIDIPHIKTRIEKIFTLPGTKLNIHWSLSGLPFLSQEGPLAAAIRTALPTPPIFSAGGGTSDGRFLAKNGREIMELGLCSAQAHAIDESVSLSELDQLTEIYYRIIENITQSFSSQFHPTQIP